jgi:hypothetical protein
LTERHSGNAKVRAAWLAADQMNIRHELPAAADFAAN